MTFHNPDPISLCIVNSEAPIPYSHRMRLSAQEFVWKKRSTKYYFCAAQPALLMYTRLTLRGHFKRHLLTVTHSSIINTCLDKFQRKCTYTHFVLHKLHWITSYFVVHCKKSTSLLVVLQSNCHIYYFQWLLLELDHNLFFKVCFHNHQ